MLCGDQRGTDSPITASMPRLGSEPTDNPMTSQQQPLCIALQGGGSHGAYTWGVLDTLLVDGRVSVNGVSGTNADALNAAALVQGFPRA